MARKELNVFSVSFLDLLSGALAAVIILFVVVPKMTSEDVLAMETIESLDVQVEQLDSLIQLARNSIPAELYEQIQQQIEQMNETIDEMREQNQQIQEALKNCEEERERLQEQMQEMQPKSSSIDRSSGAGNSLFGVDAKFAIVITWPDNIDVDIHVKNLEKNETVFFRNPSSSWGNLLTDVTQKPENEDIYELFFQKNIVPGKYQIYYHVYTNSNTPVNVNGYVVLHPFATNEYKVDLPQKTIRHSENLVFITTVNLTNNSFTLN